MKKREVMVYKHTGGAILRKIFLPSPKEKVKKKEGFPETRAAKMYGRRKVVHGSNRTVNKCSRRGGWGLRG